MIDPGMDEDEIRDFELTRPKPDSDKATNCLCGGYGEKGVHLRTDIVCPVCDRGEAPQFPTPDSELRNKLRKIIRAYYNETFEYAMEQLQKGDISAVIANAEPKQQALDDPHLDHILTLFHQHQASAVEEAREQGRDDMRTVSVECEGDNCRFCLQNARTMKELNINQPLFRTGSHFISKHELATLQSKEDKL